MLVCTSATACFEPISGAEYDNLIEVELNEEEEAYHLKVPKKLDNTGSAQIFLSYSKAFKDGVGVADFTTELTFGFSWKVITGSFKVPKREGYTPYLRVVWPGESCDTVAISRALVAVE